MLTPDLLVAEVEVSADYPQSTSLFIALGTSNLQQCDIKVTHSTP